MEEAILNANSTDTITLTNNVNLDETLEINKTVNINLNGNTIAAKEKVFLVQGGSLKLTGKGKIIETSPNYGAVMMVGSDDPDKTEFSTLSVDSGVTLEGWSGIFINHLNKTAYGINVTMDGTIISVDDINGGPGVGMYVNGNISNQENSPVINLGKNSKITSTGNGIYAAGYATYNINGAYIEGKESGLGIKSGVFNILDGTIIGSGEDKTPTSGNNNGINASGTAIQIESNNGYKGNIELNIKNGTFQSKNSNVIYEYVVNNTSTKVKKIEILDGNFTSNAKKDVFSLSDSFKNTHQGFISGGTYSSDPASYLKSGLNATKIENNLYEVVSGDSALMVTKQESKSNKGLIFIIILSIAAIIIFLFRDKIIKFIKK